MEGHLWSALIVNIYLCLLLAVWLISYLATVKSWILIYKMGWLKNLTFPTGIVVSSTMTRLKCSVRYIPGTPPTSSVRISLPNFIKHFHLSLHSKPVQNLELYVKKVHFRPKDSVALNNIVSWAVLGFYILKIIVLK